MEIHQFFHRLVGRHDAVAGVEKEGRQGKAFDCQAPEAHGTRLRGYHSVQLLLPFGAWCGLRGFPCLAFKIHVRASG
jgi:hypothetical protein